MCTHTNDSVRPNSDLLTQGKFPIDFNGFALGSDCDLQIHIEGDAP